MNVHDALTQIADIRQQVARAQTFKGYRALTTAFTGVVAIGTAAVQSVALPEPHQHVSRYAGADWGIFAGTFRLDYYLYLWCAAAVISIVVVGSEMFIRVRRSESTLQRDLTLAAVEQFVPCLVAGLLLTIVLAQFAIESVWMLPGLWMLLFAMGVYASRRVLPKFSHIVGGFYLLAGLFVLGMNRQAGLHAWTMGAVFGTGQFMAAGLLWYVERRK